MSVHYVDAFMQVALREAERALCEGEVPVGCVFVTLKVNEEAYQRLTSSADGSTAKNNEDVSELVAARGRNQTNVLHHALAHAEFIAMEELLNRSAVAEEYEHATPSSPDKINAADELSTEHNTSTSRERDQATRGLQDLSSYVLYVTVEPCIMCSAALLYNAVGCVFFGCRNPRFGGNGTVLALHEPPPLKKNRCETDCLCGKKPREDGTSAIGEDASERYRRDADSEAPPRTVTSAPSQQDQRIADVEKQKPETLVECYDGLWWPCYMSEGGYREDEAIAILQQFYERENPNAPSHKRRQKPLMR